MGLQGALERLEDVRHTTYTFDKPLSIAPGDYQAEIALSDRNSSKLSVKTIAFSVPSLPHGLTMSELSVVSHVEPLTNAIAPDDPFRVDGRRVVPQLMPDDHPASNRELPVFFVIYPDGQSTEKPHLTLQLRRDEKTVTSLPMPLPETRPGEPIPYITGIRPQSLPNGFYRLLATVTQGGARREQELSFVIEGHSPLAAVPAVPIEAKPEAVEDVAHLDFLVKPKLLEGAAAPSQDELAKLLASARQRSLDYQKDLPNVMCVEHTIRSVDPTGRAAWRTKDSTDRLLRYVNGEERSNVLAVNGQRTGDGGIGGVHLSGEFGGLLFMLFSDRSAASIDWQGFSEINGTRMHVLRYKVAQPHSTYRVIGGADGPSILSAFEGLVYVDANTLGVRRITLQAEGLPSNFPIQESAVTVDYDYVPLGGHDYLLPQQAELYVREHAHSFKRNEIKFLNYRRFGAESKIKF